MRNSEQIVLNIHELLMIEYNENNKKWEMFLIEKDGKRFLNSKKFKKNLITEARLIKCGLAKISDYNKGKEV